MSHSKAPRLGDLVSWVEDIGIIEDVRGEDIKVRWLMPIKNGFDDRKIDFSWMTPRNVEVLSRA
jgi:hypothetical protein